MAALPPLTPLIDQFPLVRLSPVGKQNSDQLSTSSRHLLLTYPGRVGIRPMVAQKLARYADIRLTLVVYTHAELANQTAAIEVLLGPPGE